MDTKSECGNGALGSGALGSNDGVRVEAVPGQGAGLFAVRDFAKGDVVCCEKPLLCYGLRDAMAERVGKFMAPHRSVAQGGRWGDDCPGALPYAFQWTLFLANLSLLSDDERTHIENSFYAPSIEDDIPGRLLPCFVCWCLAAVLTAYEKCVSLGT